SRAPATGARGGGAAAGRGPSLCPYLELLAGGPRSRVSTGHGEINFINADGQSDSKRLGGVSRWQGPIVFDAADQVRGHARQPGQLRWAVSFFEADPPELGPEGLSALPLPSVGEQHEPDPLPGDAEFPPDRRQRQSLGPQRECPRQSPRVPPPAA